MSESFLFCLICFIHSAVDQPDLNVNFDCDREVADFFLSFFLNDSNNTSNYGIDGLPKVTFGMMMLLFYVHSDTIMYSDRDRNIDVLSFTVRRL